MFVVLLIVTFVVALAMSALVALLFARPIGKILNRLVAEDLSFTWRRYIVFAIFVVGISGGARLWEVEKYIRQTKKANSLSLRPPDG